MAFHRLWTYMYVMWPPNVPVVATSIAKFQGMKNKNLQDLFKTIYDFFSEAR